MEGTGGIRKLRWGRGAQGKSDGFRVTYFFHDESIALYLLTLFAKNQRANFIKGERNELASLVELLVQIWLDTYKGAHMTKAFDSIKKRLDRGSCARQVQRRQACWRQALPTACSRRFKPARALVLDARAIRRPLRIFSRHTAPLGTR